MNEVIAVFKEDKAGFLVGRSVDGIFSNLKVDWRDALQADPRATQVAWRVEIVKEGKNSLYVRLIEPDRQDLAAKFPAATAFLEKEGQICGTKLPQRLAPWKAALNQGSLDVLARLERLLQPAFSYGVLNNHRANELLELFAAGRKPLRR